MKENDYELIYLLNEGNYTLVEYMIEKYKPLANSLIFKYKVPWNLKEDYLQECLMIIYKCIVMFDDSKGLFFSFCKTCLERKIISLLYQSKDKNYTFVSFDEEIKVNEEPIHYNEVMDTPDFKQLLEIKQVGINEYAKEKNMSIKQVYNHIFKLKKRIKSKSSN